jgi:protease IV
MNNAASRLLRLAAVSLCALAGVALPALASDPAPVKMLTLENSLSDRPSPLAWLSSKPEPTLRQVISSLHELAEQAPGNLVIRLKDAALTRGDIDELASALKKVRAAGHTVRLFAENYGPAELMLGASTDELIMQSGGAVSLPGLYAEEMYLADTLSWIGIKPQMIQVGDYKGANEQFMNNAPSKAWDQNINQLLDSLYGHMRDTISTGRGMQASQLETAMKTAWWADGPEAIAAGLISTELDLPALGRHINKQRHRDSDEITWETLAPVKGGGMKLDMANPFAMMNMFMKKPSNKPKRPSLGILHIDGAIMDGDSQEGGFMGSASVGSRTIRNAIEELKKEDLIKGVVVRIDSPGGSAIASEVIWQGLQRLAKDKPVWVSIGDMAASGGYYIAVGGQKIYANPSSIIGSIGVVGGKMSMGGLYEHGKVRVFPRARGPMASMMDTTKPWSPEEVQLVRDRMKKTYDLFASRVSAGRPGIDLAKTAEGRLFTGDKAVELKMADKIGGLDDCLTDLATSLKLEDYDVMDYPGAKGLDEILEETFKGFVSAPNVGTPKIPASGELAMLVQAAVGEHAFTQIQRSLAALMQLRSEPVILAAPSVLIFK